MSDPKSTARGWNIAAEVYASELDADIAALRRGEYRFLPLELPYLRDLGTWCRRAVHLQCSHGFETLALWRLGAAEVVGLDQSPAMLGQARRKAAALHAPAHWIEADVLAPQPHWEGTADLVYTGKGALPWVSDLAAWADRCVRWLRPGGRFLLVEAHPLNWIWMPDAPGPVVRPEAGYFDTRPRPNRDFPGQAIDRLAPPTAPPPIAWEHHWPLGSIVTTLTQAGLQLLELREDATPFWNQFPTWHPQRRASVPATFALWMHRPAI